MCDICGNEINSNLIFLEDDDYEFIFEVCSICFKNIKYDSKILKNCLDENFVPKKITFDDFHKLIPCSQSNYDFFKKFIY